MDDLISRQAAIDAFEDTTFTKNEVRRRLSELPSAQPEIIHCENCKNWQTDWSNREWGLGYHWCSCVDGIRRSDWFCADAERRNDE